MDNQSLPVVQIGQLLGHPGHRSHQGQVIEQQLQHPLLLPGPHGIFLPLLCLVQQFPNLVRVHIAVVDLAGGRVVADKLVVQAALHHHQKERYSADHHTLPEHLLRPQPLQRAASRFRQRTPRPEPPERHLHHQGRGLLLGEPPAPLRALRAGGDAAGGEVLPVAAGLEARALRRQPVLLAGARGELVHGAPPLRARREALVHAPHQPDGRPPQRGVHRSVSKLLQRGKGEPVHPAPRRPWGAHKGRRDGIFLFVAVGVVVAVAAVFLPLSFHLLCGQHLRREAPEFAWPPGRRRAGRDEAWVVCEGAPDSDLWVVAVFFLSWRIDFIWFQV
mmetsp:Transcript_22536/g.39324  ORF Transcript_22536/g.39324 Transcript_22536/m.39324 type:complete len:332 (-) Transcript_22536:321-1316(-)